MQTAVCLSFPTQLFLHPEVGERTACTGTAFLFLITDPPLPLFAFHLHHQLPKWVAPKPLMIFQAQEDSLPFIPGGTDSSHWRGQVQCFSLQNSRTAWRATGYKTIPTHCSNYPLSAVTPTRASRYQEEDCLPQVSHLPLFLNLFLLWSKERENYYPKMYAQRDRRRKGTGWTWGKQRLNCCSTKLRTSTHVWVQHLLLLDVLLLSVKGQHGNEHNTIPGWAKSRDSSSLISK